MYLHNIYYAAIVREAPIGVFSKIFRIITKLNLSIVPDIIATFNDVKKFT